jgi:pyrimidine operon attenuation protein / uracil phosphoribosyltransferase
MTVMTPKVIMNAEEMAQALDALAQKIFEAHTHVDTIYLLGILSRGRPLADRIAQRIEKITGNAPRVGSLSTTLYRDDLRSGKISQKLGGNETHFDFDVDGNSIVMVDDVLNSGRTIRAALDEIMDYGRPSRIQLACLIDRGLREVPIQADYLGKSIQTEATDHIQVNLKELDEEDSVVLKQA